MFGIYGWCVVADDGFRSLKIEVRAAKPLNCFRLVFHVTAPLHLTFAHLGFFLKRNLVCHSKI
jgi:hypothetical protein